LSNAGDKVLAIKAKDWRASNGKSNVTSNSEICSPCDLDSLRLAGASAFANAAVRAGSVFAKFFVGSVNFYCVDVTNETPENNAINRTRGKCFPITTFRRLIAHTRLTFLFTISGAELLADAARDGSEDAHHVLAVMHFNGSGGLRKDKDPEAGAALCVRGNILFNSVAAKRELGHCLQDGFGVERDAVLGKKLLQEAAAIDQANGVGMDVAVVAASAAAAEVEEVLRKRNDINTLTKAIDAAAQVAAAAKTAASKHLTKTSTQKFLLDWYGECGNLLLPGTTSCSHPLCGRVETRRHEFRRCSCCGRVRYCSRSCQSADWRLQHKFACLPLLELYGWAESDTDSMDDETPGMPVGTPGVDA
jgi:predicted kinase